MNKRLRIYIGLLVVITLFILFLFAYKRNLLDYSTSIDAERFSHFGTFVSSLFGILTIVFIYLTFKQTQQTQKITVETLKETKKNSIENTFFNLFQAHQNIVSNLHQRITGELKIEYSRLDNEHGEVFGYKDDKDFFELMYRMLHLRYHGRSNPLDRSRISSFYRNYDWIMGHYFRSLIYFINWIEGNNQLNETEKEFYINFIQSQLSNDELRLVFYYAISREENVQKQICKVLNKYSFFTPVKDSLIYQDNQEDWNYFVTISNQS